MFRSKLYVSGSILTISIFILCADSAHIVFYHNIASYSHRVVTYPLADALAKRGHNVTFISPFHPKGPYINPNVSELVPKPLAATMEAFLAADFDINMRIQRTLKSNIRAFFPTGVLACKDLLESDEFKSFVDKTASIDLLILDDCMTECGMFLKYKYGAKHIFFNTIVYPGFEYDMYGVTPDSSSVPELELFAPRAPMSFLERVNNALTSIYFRYVHYTDYSPQIDEILRKYPGNDKMPFVDELFRNTSLVLAMGDMVTDYARSLPAMFVNVGGLHCQNGVKPLPDELRNFVEDEESQGFVYMSLGSLVDSSKLPPETKKVFFKSMELFPKLKFLWKWNGPFPEKESLPKNLHLGRWFPQNDLLGHPKIKAFITQSGRPSVQEALCAAVPMIAIPVVGDQDGNANRMNQMGGNVILYLGAITVPSLTATLQQVTSKEMRARMNRLKTIFEDQPMTPLERAVWWTEYVLRHPDTEHLKPAGFDQWWFQRRLIDVWAFIFTVILISVMIFAKIIVSICKLALTGNEKFSEESFKKKN